MVLVLDQGGVPITRYFYEVAFYTQKYMVSIPTVTGVYSYDQCGQYTMFYK